jgi:hypothetical protein
MKFTPDKLAELHRNAERSHSVITQAIIDGLALVVFLTGILALMALLAA